LNEVTVQKSDLLKVLQQNRADHRKIFEEALVGFEKAATADLQRELDRLRAGKRRSIFIQRPVPVDHTRDYDRAIRMIEMSIGDTITVSEGDFQSYVMDDWGWAHEFATTATAYHSALAKTKFGSREDDD
jgi:hypothetical protein